MKALLATKQRFLGSVKTIDDDFELQRKLFNRYKESLKSTSHATARLVKACASVAKATTSVSESLDAVAPGDSAGEARARTIAAALASSPPMQLDDVASAVAAFDEYVRDRLGRAKSLQSQIDARDTAAGYADAMREKAQKDVGKASYAEAEARRDAAVDAYEQLNAPLIDALAAFSGEPVYDFEPTLRLFTRRLSTAFAAAQRDALAIQV